MNNVKKTIRMASLAWAAMLITTGTGHARVGVGRAPKLADSVLECTIFDDRGGNRGQLMIFSDRRGMRPRILDVQTSALDLGLNGAAKTIVEANGVFKITPHADPTRAITINTNGGGGSLLIGENEDAYSLRGCRTTTNARSR